MKLSLAAISLLALAASSNAQYFSGGWRPGQAAQETTDAYVPEPSSTPEPAAPAQPQKPFSLSSLFDFNRILTSAPAAALFSQVGINITEKVQAALDVKIWDERVELITDDNYKDIIVNEPMTEQEEKDRVWIIVMCVYCYEYTGSRADVYFAVLLPPPSRMASQSSSMRSLTRLSTTHKLQETYPTSNGDVSIT